MSLSVTQSVWILRRKPCETDHKTSPTWVLSVSGTSDAGSSFVPLDTKEVSLQYDSRNRW